VDLSRYQQLIETSFADFTKELPKTPAGLYDPIRYTLSLSGKRLRPQLVLMGAGLFSNDVEDALPAARGIELFHNFTLLHDDIMDKAPLRRGQPSVHVKWNNSIAILSGDALYTEAFRQMAKSPQANLPAILDLFTRTALEVCEGQQLDMDFETRANVSIADYLHMIGLKTAVLLAASLETGALCVNAAAADAKKLYAFGKHIGIAFQLQDDILDVYGDAGKFGKTSGGDIVANKKTFLLLKAMELASRYQAEELQNWMNVTASDAKAKVDGVKAIYDVLDVRNLAVAEMKKHFEKSLAELEKINAADERKNVFRRWAEELMDREN
jgi:geranylgeranyl diphosphate synthase, type II